MRFCSNESASKYFRLPILAAFSLLTGFLITGWRLIMTVVTLGISGLSSLCSQFPVNTFNHSRIMFPPWMLWHIYPSKVESAEHAWEIWEVPCWSPIEDERAGVSEWAQTPSQMRVWTPQKRLLKERKKNEHCSFLSLLPCLNCSPLSSAVSLLQIFFFLTTPFLGYFFSKIAVLFLWEQKPLASLGRVSKDAASIIKSAISLVQLRPVSLSNCTTR